LKQKNNPWKELKKEERQPVKKFLDLIAEADCGQFPPQVWVDHRWPGGGHRFYYHSCWVHIECDEAAGRLWIIDFGYQSKHERRVAIGAGATPTQVKRG
jgi:hypothetical protein